MRALSSSTTFNDPVKCLYCFTVKFLAGWSRLHHVRLTLHTLSDSSYSFLKKRVNNKYFYLYLLLILVQLIQLLSLLVLQQGFLFHFHGNGFIQLSFSLYNILSNGKMRLYMHLPE